jgi:hypothetical protein
MSTNIKTDRKGPARLAPEDFQVIEEMIESAIGRKLSGLNGNTAPKFSNDDARFLIWTLGFTAGANLERDGQRGERIFAWCRDLHEKMMGQTGEHRAGNGS